jgi:hypothetical protein
VLGSPILRAGLAFVVLLLLLVPMRLFTAPQAQVATPAPVKTQDSAAHLEIVSTKAPFVFAVTHLGKIIWEGESSGASVSADLRLPIPKEGVDLAVRLDWLGNETAAAKLILTHADDDPVERTVWGNRTAEDVLTFP